MQKELNPKLWEDKKLKRDVREAIIDIVSEFMDNFKQFVGFIYNLQSLTNNI